MAELTEIAKLTTGDWWWVLGAASLGNYPGMLAMLIAVILGAPWWAKTIMIAWMFLALCLKRHGPDTNADRIVAAIQSLEKTLKQAREHLIYAYETKDHPYRGVGPAVANDGGKR